VAKKHVKPNQVDVRNVKQKMEAGIGLGDHSLTKHARMTSHDAT
jgi:hypothetical protein